MEAISDNRNRDFVKFMRNGVLKIFAALFGLGMLVSCANNKLTAEIDTLEIVLIPPTMINKTKTVITRPVTQVGTCFGE